MAVDTMAKALEGKRPDMSGLFGVPTTQLQVMKDGKVKGKDMRDIQIIRHGATKLNNDDASVDRVRGWKDIPLSPDGKSEAERLGTKLKSTPPDVLVSSDLKRAHDTAKIISDKTGVPISAVTKDFRPWNAGDFAGKPSSEAVPILAEYATKTPDKEIPGGESFNTFRLRFLQGLANTLDRHDGKIAIVTHHRGERLLHAWRKAGFPKNGDIDMGEFNKKGEHPGAITEMEIPKTWLRSVTDGLAMNDQPFSEVASSDRAKDHFDMPKTYAARKA